MTHNRSRIFSDVSLVKHIRHKRAMIHISSCICAMGGGGKAQKYRSEWKKNTQLGDAAAAAVLSVIVLFVSILIFGRTARLV